MRLPLPGPARRQRAMLWGVLAVLALTALRVLNGAPVTPPVLLGYAALVGGVVLVAERGLAEQRLAALPLWSLALLLLAIPAVVYATIASTLSALLLIAAWFVVVLWCDGVLLRRERWWLAWFARLLLALLAGGVPVAIGQLESRFADEEFFVALEALALAVVWLLVRAACCSLVGPSHPHRLPRRHRRLGLLYLLVCAFVGAAGLVGAYQRSFYPATAPAFGRITPAAPFACREVAPDPTTYDGQPQQRRRRVGAVGGGHGRIGARPALSRRVAGRGASGVVHRPGQQHENGATQCRDTHLLLSARQSRVSRLV
jgi:hypothetical protein